MGTWGTAIFADDLASDVRESWRDLVAAGVSTEEATERIRTGYSSSIADPAQRSVVWLALALSQSSTGRLIDPVRDAALAVIDDGSDLARWPEGRDRAARERVLAEARAELTSPRPASGEAIPAGRAAPPPPDASPAAAARHRNASRSPFSPGDVILYRHTAGPHFLLWVSHNTSDSGGEYSCVDVLDVVGDPPFDLTEVARLGTMQGWDQFDTSRPQQLRFVVVDPSKLPKARATVIGSTLQPDRQPKAARIGIPARHLDDWLRPFLPGGDRVLRRLPARRPPD